MKMQSRLGAREVVVALFFLWQQLSFQLVLLVVCRNGSGSAAASTSTSNSAASESQLERNILAAVYSQTNGPSWTRSKNWLSAEVHYCDWEGISCTTPGSTSRQRRKLSDATNTTSTTTTTTTTTTNTGTDESRSIQSIDLSENNLQGSVPFSLLALLPNIKSIKLKGNDIDYVNSTSQEIQVLGQALDPVERTVTSIVQHIDVSYTKVKNLARLFQVGNSSTTLIQTPSLTELYASQAQISGRFPTFVFAMSSLQHLALDQNSITGTLPSTIGKCRQLNFISLSSNSMTGTIPASVGQLNKLRYFLMESNQLHGTIPLGLVSGAYTPLLEQLDLSNQRSVQSKPSKRLALTGKLPSFNSQKRLRRVDLGVNSFTGPIPSDLLQGISFNDFDFIILSSNALTGSVPSSVIHRIPVDSLLLENNRITQVNTADCSSLPFGCDSFLCAPGYYESRVGRQEESSRKCQECVENTKYWGQTICQVGETTSSPVSGPTAPGASPTSPPATSPTSVSQEMQILMSLYTATDGEKWLDRTGWLTTSASNSTFCDWLGVQCMEADVDSVLSIRLPANGLVGTIPTAIFQLPNLQAIDFSLNDNLTFDFVGIGNCPSLRYIDLTSIGDITHFESIQNASGTLEQLILSSVSAFSGSTLPSVLWNMTNLQRLIMDYDNLVGPIPTDVGNLTNLVAFSVAVNELTGTLPETISMMTDLIFLRLSTNHLQGTLPASLQNMTSLNVLDLSNQWSNGVDDNFDNAGHPGLTGTLPLFAGFSQIQRLDLSVNSFTGTIPENFLPDVDNSVDGLFQYADISVNFLTGTVPATVSNLSIVYIQDNHLTGIQPAACTQLPANLSQFGCDAVLCPPRTYNGLGKQTSAEDPCKPCNGNAPYFGSTTCFNPLNVGSSSNDTVRQALAAIYNNCGGDKWTAKGSWLAKSSSVCTWDGIRCSTNDAVVGISLRSNNLIGTFPSKQVFASIPHLQAIVLEENDIFFPFDGIDQASNLKILDLTSTQIAKVEGIEKAPALENVFLGSNGLSGTFPTSLLVLSGLKRLTLAFNAFGGTIPTEIGKLTRLEFLSLHDNGFEGVIPSHLGKLSKLTFLLLQGNNLAGTIPQSLAFLTNLKSLDLSQQGGIDAGGLNGTLPSFAAMPNLQFMDLHQNRLTGSIPGDFLNRTAVATFQDLDLSQNLLTGTAPAILQKFKVSEYDLTGNRITGLDSQLCAASLGEEVAAFGCSAVLCPNGTFNEKGRQTSTSDACKPCSKSAYWGGRSCGSATLSPTPSPGNEISDKTILSKFYNALGGDRWTRKDRWMSTTSSVCNWFGIRCSTDGNQHIEQIVLPTNNLIGTVPTEIFQLPYLETLILNSNKIQIELSSIKNSRGLLTLDLSNTGIRTVEGIGGANTLRELNIASNMLRGTFPEEIFKIETLEQLTFDYNGFTGTLSSSLQSLSNLKLLSGVKSSLKGSIPTELLLLTSLVTLKLSRNSLSGPLPDGLKSLTDLAIVDLSQSSLLGPLPSFAGVTTITQLDLSNNALSGTIPSNFLDSVNTDDFEYADLSSNSIKGKLPASIAALGNVYVGDNQISGIAPELCKASRGAVFGMYGCNAVLCPPGTFSAQGRQESDASYCQNCTQSLFYGATSCAPRGVSPSGSPPTVDTRQVLINLYQTCGGQSWDENTNWLQVSVSICNWFGITCVEGSEEVAKIDLGANNLIGTPPTELFALPALRSLALYSNPLGGFDFEGVQYATKLNELKLDATGLTSLAGIGNAPNLTKLNLRFNLLDGKVPTELTKLTTLQSLSLAHNALTGTLPAALEKLSNLHALLLSYNKLGGPLQGVNFPSSIRLLDLSNNGLTGSIPESFLTQVPFDAQLDIDLSDNQLAGGVPSALTRFANLNIYLTGNKITQLDPQLCTQPLWNDGDVGRYGCAGLLCPPEEYAPQGRQVSLEEPCQSCGTSRVYGTADCSASAAMSALPWNSLHKVLTCLFVLAVSWITAR